MNLSLRLSTLVVSRDSVDGKKLKSPICELFFKERHGKPLVTFFVVPTLDGFPPAANDDQNCSILIEFKNGSYTLIKPKLPERKKMGFFDRIPPHHWIGGGLLVIAITVLCCFTVYLLWPSEKPTGLQENEVKGDQNNEAADLPRTSTEPIK